MADFDSSSLAVSEYMPDRHISRVDVLSNQLREMPAQLVSDPLLFCYGQGKIGREALMQGNKRFDVIAQLSFRVAQEEFVKPLICQRS